MGNADQTKQTLFKLRVEQRVTHNHIDPLVCTFNWLLIHHHGDCRRLTPSLTDDCQKAFQLVTFHEKNMDSTTMGSFLSFFHCMRHVHPTRMLRRIASVPLQALTQLPCGAVAQLVDQKTVAQSLHKARLCVGNCICDSSSRVCLVIIAWLWIQFRLQRPGPSCKDLLSFSLQIVQCSTCFLTEASLGDCNVWTVLVSRKLFIILSRNVSWNTACTSWSHNGPQSAMEKLRLIFGLSIGECSGWAL